MKSISTFFLWIFILLGSIPGKSQPAKPFVEQRYQINLSDEINRSEFEPTLSDDRFSFKNDKNRNFYIYHEIENEHPIYQLHEKYFVDLICSLNAAKLYSNISFGLSHSYKLFNLTGQSPRADLPTVNLFSCIEMNYNYIRFDSIEAVDSDLGFHEINFGVSLEINDISITYFRSNLNQEIFSGQFEGWGFFEIGLSL